MEDFFKKNEYTEFYFNGEVWVFGDTPENITENTPHQFVCKDNYWGDGSEKETELPITDGHGMREWVRGRFYIGQKHELLGTTAEEKIRNFHNFN